MNVIAWELIKEIQNSEASFVVFILAVRTSVKDGDFIQTAELVRMFLLAISYDLLQDRRLRSCLFNSTVSKIFLLLDEFR